MHLWAGVRFTALGGQTADFLQRATAKNYKLRNIHPALGGVSAQCAAHHYFALCKLAKACHVRLHVVARQGLYFRLRGIGARLGIWCGLAVCCLLFVLNQNLVWQIDTSDLTVGQSARVEEVLWQSCGIAAGAYVSEELLAAGEAALLSYDDSFSWVSLNFSGGRLVVEASAATAVPEIAVGAAENITASTAGTVVSVNVQQGTPMVSTGQEVLAGDVLIAAARLEHDQESLVFEPTAGEVLAQFVVEDAITIAMVQQTQQPSAPLGIETQYSFFVMGQLVVLPEWLSWVDDISLPTVFAFPDLSNLFITSTTTKPSFRLSDFRFSDFSWSNLLGAFNELSLFRLPDFFASLGNRSQATTDTKTTTRRTQLTWLGFALPITIFEENTVSYASCTLLYNQDECLALARLACSEALYAKYPDAIIVDTQEVVFFSQEQLQYEVSYTIVADICT